MTERGLGTGLSTGERWWTDDSDWGGHPTTTTRVGDSSWTGDLRESTSERAVAVALLAAAHHPPLQEWKAHRQRQSDHVHDDLERASWFCE